MNGRRRNCPHRHYITHRHQSEYVRAFDKLDITIVGIRKNIEHDTIREAIAQTDPNRQPSKRRVLQPEMAATERHFEMHAIARADSITNRAFVRSNKRQ